MKKKKKKKKRINDHTFFFFFLKFRLRLNFCFALAEHFEALVLLAGAEYLVDGVGAGHGEEDARHQHDDAREEEVGALQQDGDAQDHEEDGDGAQARHADHHQPDLLPHVALAVLAAVAVQARALSDQRSSLPLRRREDLAR